MRSTITNAGRDLLARLELNEISMEFSEIRTGSGVYGSTEPINTATALKAEKNVYHISSSETTASGFMLTAGISNVDSEGESIVDETYRINEIGVFVTVDGVKYLYMIAVCDGDTGNVLPVYTGNNAIDYVEKFMLTISNTANVTINMSGAYALSEDVVRWISDHADLPTHLSAQERINWNGEQEKTTVFNQDGSITETTADGDMTTEFNEDGSITETYPDGRILTTYFDPDGTIRRVLGEWEPENPTDPTDSEEQSEGGTNNNNEEEET